MKFAYLPSWSPSHPPKNDAIIPPIAKLDTDRDQSMVMMAADVSISSSAQGVDVGLLGGGVVGTFGVLWIAWLLVAFGQSVRTPKTLL